MDSTGLATLRPGNDRDFDTLYRETWRSVFQISLAILRDVQAAEDSAQETYVRAYRAWPKWRPEAPVQAWLHRIAVNTARSARRRLFLRELPAILDRVPGHQDVDHHDDRSGVLALLQQIPRDDATALMLRHHHGFSVPEVAMIMGIGERTVRLRVQRGREKVAKLMGQSLTTVDTETGWRGAHV